MMYKGGKTSAKHWRNSLTKQVDARMNSVMDAHRNRIENSLAVENIECIVYRRTRTGLPCSCTMVPQDIGVLEASGCDEQQNEGVFKINNGLFGNREVKTESVFDAIELGTLIQEETGDPLITSDGSDWESLGSQGINCPMCYREGWLPAYQPVGYQSILCSEHNCVQYQGYGVDGRPLTYTRLETDGHVDYQVSVPKYWVSATYSIRTAKGILLPTVEKPTICVGAQELPLTMATLETLRGKRCVLRIRAQEFSHCVLNFCLGAQPIGCNISEETKVLDYEKEQTISDLNIVLPHRVGELGPQDVLVLPSRNLVLMVTGVPQKRNASNKVWEYTVPTRTVQRGEQIFNIHRGYRIA